MLKIDVPVCEALSVCYQCNKVRRHSVRGHAIGQAAVGLKLGLPDSQAEGCL